MAVNKHKALQNWVQQFLDEQYLYFESTEAYPNIRTVVPEYGERVLRTDILGDKYCRYTFVFVGYEQIDTGTSDINSNNMKLFDDFAEWVEQQQENSNFPNFGDNVSEYELKVVQNMANLAYVTNEGIAKYMLAVNINYKESEVN